MKVNYDDLIEQIHSFESELGGMSLSELASQTPKLKKRLNEGEDAWDILPEAFAVVQEVSERMLGKRHFDVQLMGGIALFEGHITEMKTGEGKTITSLLPAYLHALEGRKVHIITVNEYLARRDQSEMRKVFNFLGLTVGIVLNGMSTEVKQANYAKNIIYGVANEFGFDYLRNNTALSKEDLTIGDLGFALIDEVDSILIDESKTPLILSGGSREDSHLFYRATSAAEQMVRGESELQTKLDRLVDGVQVDEDAHYLVEQERNISLTDKGVEFVKSYFDMNPDIGGIDPLVYHAVKQAIHAKELMEIDRDYVVNSGEIKIIDESTGRIAEGRRFKDGLHQALEAKEGLEVQGESRTIASITLQNFFMKYEYFAGMTGTALTETEEFLDVYHKRVAEIPTNKPLIREDLPDQIYATKEGKYQAIIDRLKNLNGQPVLVGVATVEQSEELAKVLKDAGFLDISVLNAKNHLEEAMIVAQAGRVGHITISTNMAGRGTDILLGGSAEYRAQSLLLKEGVKPAHIRLVSAPTLVLPDTVEDPTYLVSLHVRYRMLVAAQAKMVEEERERVLAKGGLYVLGTQRNESKRVDNQLRGRSGRQGDPGKSEFIISLEDSWLKPFKAILPKHETETYEPIPRKKFPRLFNQRDVYDLVDEMQRKIESQGFKARETLTEYDEVDAIIRDKVYALREHILTNQSGESVFNFLMEDAVDLYEASGGEILPSFELPEVGTGDSVSRILKRQYKKRLQLIENLALFNNSTLDKVLHTLVLETLDQEWMSLLISLNNDQDATRLSFMSSQKPLHLYRERVMRSYDGFVDQVRIALVEKFYNAPHHKHVLDYSIFDV